MKVNYHNYKTIEMWRWWWWRENNRNVVAMVVVVVEGKQ